jgi:hypothetical protein
LIELLRLISQREHFTVSSNLQYVLLLTIDNVSPEMGVLIPKTLQKLESSQFKDDTVRLLIRKGFLNFLRNLNFMSDLAFKAAFLWASFFSSFLEIDFMSDNIVLESLTATLSAIEHLETIQYLLCCIFHRICASYQQSKEVWNIMKIAVSKTSSTQWTDFMKLVPNDPQFVLRALLPSLAKERSCIGMGLRKCFSLMFLREHHSRLNDEAESFLFDEGLTKSIVLEVVTPINTLKISKTGVIIPAV